MRLNKKVDMKGYFTRALLLGTLVIITGCAGAVALKYKPSVEPAVKLEGPASVRVVPYIDARGVKDPRLAGEIEETVIDIISDRLELTEDVSTIVTGALSAELKAAGFSVVDGMGGQGGQGAPGGPGGEGLVLTGEVKEFWFDIIEGGLLRIELDSKITHATSGRELWSGVTKETASGFTGQTSNAVVGFMAVSLQRAAAAVAAEAVRVAGAGAGAGAAGAAGGKSHSAPTVIVPGSPGSPDAGSGVKTMPPHAAPPVAAPAPVPVTPIEPEIETVVLEPIPAPPVVVEPALEVESAPALLAPALPVPPAAALTPITPLAEGTGRIIVTTDPPRAKVYIGDVYYGLSPQSIDLEPGVFEVYVKMKGYKTESEKVAVRDRVIVELDVLLTR